MAHGCMLAVLAGALFPASALAQAPLPEATFEGFFTGDIIPTPRQYRKLEGELLLARRGAGRSEACVLLPDGASSAAVLAAEELQLRVTRLLGEEALLPVTRDTRRAARFRTVIALVPGPTATGSFAGFAPPAPSPEAYRILPGEEGWVHCWGESHAGTYFAVQTLMQLTFEREGAVYLQRAAVADWPAFSLRSFKSGGTDWNTLREMGRWSGHYKYNCYNVCYTTLGADLWKGPAAEYRQLLADLAAWSVPRGLDVMPFVNPYYLWKEHIVTSDPAQIDQLTETCAIALEHGARKVMLCLDDFASEALPYVIRSEADRQRFATLGAANALLIAELHGRLRARHPDAELFVVPPYYWIPQGGYREQGEADLCTIGQTVPRDVHLVWTGPVVRSATVRREDFEAYAALIGRAPFLWDNTIYMHHNPPSYLFDPFVTRYPDRFWELNDTGVHYNAGNGEVYKVGLMTIADYLWNPEAYEPEASLRRALHQATGSPEAVEACLALRDAYYAIYDGYRPVLDSLLKLKTDADFPYRPFDEEDFDRIEGQLRAVTEAHGRVRAASRNARLSAELGERIAPYERYRDMLAWLREHQGPEVLATEDMAVNGGAEEADAAGRPVGWGLYTGAGSGALGTSEEGPAEGKRCAYLEAKAWHDLQGREWINVALMFGASDGFAGPEAYVAQPLTKYRVTFRLRGDAAPVQLTAVGWSTEKADSSARQTLFCNPSEIRAAPEWREYEARFTTALDTRRFALKFGLTGYRSEGAQLGRAYVDDVRLMCPKRRPDQP